MKQTAQVRAKMSPEKQRIAIAAACGWRPKPEVQDPKSLWDDVSIAKMMNDPKYLPDYRSDLNAMHEAEKACIFDLRRSDLDPQIAMRFSSILTGFTHPNCFATAAQHAEAFLRTIGRWEE